MELSFVASFVNTAPNIAQIDVLIAKPLFPVFFRTLVKHVRTFSSEFEAFIWLLIALRLLIYQKNDRSATKGQIEIKSIKKAS